ncbi:ABC transporter permease [Fodinisporobacter ferrooxydans]|uniref:ABC transporter permease n=1 Tax=Fodinisporobacter ferrooxydans TaxID=2901836 RepID=A0ABY4CLY0_9BACL|nr:ABC transporter permease [Alicyclobacillaceae bacterium MYW30-H2]
MEIKKQFLGWTSFPSLALVVLLTIINTFVVNNFLSVSYASSFFGDYTPLIIAAIAQTIVLIGSGIDLSIGGIISLVVVVVVTLADPNGHYQFPLPVAMVIGTVLGGAVGALNGLIIGYLRVTPLLATLATTSIAEGLALTIMPQPGGSISTDFTTWYGSSLLGIIPAPIVFILIALAIWMLWKYSPKGLQLYAMGRDINKTYVSGIAVQRIQLLMYISSGILSAIAALALLGTTGAGDPLIGTTYTLYAVAASVIGGVSLMGGSGDTFGAIFGSIFLGCAFTLVFSIHLESYYQNLASGVIVLLGIIGASMLKKKKFSLSS